MVVQSSCQNNAVVAEEDGGLACLAVAGTVEDEEADH